MKSFTKLLFSVFTVFFVLGVASVADAYGQLDDILKRMDEHNKSLASLRSSVTMSKQNAQLGGKPDLLKGKVIYMAQKGKSAYVRIDWERPVESLSVVDKDYVIYRQRLNQAIKGKTNSVSGNAKANGALSFMNMSRAELKVNYSIAYLGEATLASGVRTWHLRLTPKTATSYQTAEIWVDPDGMPQQSKITEKNNDTTTMLLTEIVKNPRLRKADFTIVIPKNVEWIKG